MLWFKCAAMHDPVRPVIKQPVILGWAAKNREVDQTIEGPLKGDELLRRMNGWFTADVHKAIEIFEQYGRLKVLDGVDLVVETPGVEQMNSLAGHLADIFGQEVWIETMAKTILE